LAFGGLWLLKLPVFFVTWEDAFFFIFYFPGDFFTCFLEVIFSESSIEGCGDLSLKLDFYDMAS
jgi:hypothetical protein